MKAGNSGGSKEECANVTPQWMLGATTADEWLQAKHLLCLLERVLSDDILEKANWAQDSGQPQGASSKGS